MGLSNHKHVFEYSSRLPSGKIILTDPVSRDSNSINARVVAHLDVKQKSNPQYILNAVYDDQEDWGSDDLRLLSMGTEPVKWSKAAYYFERLKQSQADLH